jgi:hypothetical protein
MNTTPLRLVAIEERPPEEDEQSGAPIVMISEQDAITRRVPDSDIIASQDTFRDLPKRSSRWKIFLPAGAVAVAVVVVVIALATKGKSAAAPTPINAIAAPVPIPQESPQPQPSPAPAAPAAASSTPGKTAPEIIRLGITADPMETELSLDGNVLASHRLNLEVPKDRGIHVVSASAPGYIPFNQQVSFSSDVVLKINLHRAHTPPVRQGARSRPSQLDSSPKSNVRPAAVSPRLGLEPGMNLEGPSVRPNSKQIDERNPYKP